MSRSLDLMEWFRANGFDQYGAVMEESELMKYLDLEMPETGTWHDFQRIRTAMLNPVDHIRNTLINEGKYLRKEGEFYRVLLPSENAGQVRSYEDSASRKLSRAEKLRTNTPVVHKEVHDHQSVRLHMKQSALRDSRIYGRKTNDDSLPPQHPTM